VNFMNFTARPRAAAGETLVSTSALQPRRRTTFDRVNFVNFPNPHDQCEHWEHSRGRPGPALADVPATLRVSADRLGGPRR
jgi:hypothetical protein